MELGWFPLSVSPYFEFDSLPTVYETPDDAKRSPSYDASIKTLPEKT